MTCDCPTDWCYRRRDCRHDSHGLLNTRLKQMRERRAAVAQALADETTPAKDQRALRSALDLLDQVIARLR